MKDGTRNTHWLTAALALLAGLLMVSPAQADTLISDFDNFFFMDDQYASWWDFPEPKETNWTISASYFGGGYKGLDTNIDASAENTIELTVTIEDTNVPPVNVIAGPIVVLADADGTEWAWAWYGKGPGSYVLTADLSTPTFTSLPGTIPGFDSTNLSDFHIQVDPGAFTNVYTITVENLRLLYVEPPTPKCDTLVSDFDNAGLLGGYESWTGVIPPPQPGDWTITATDFGGGWQNINPNIDASAETMIELRATITNVTGLVGPIVVLQDGDGTQLTWPWYGLTNGSYVLATNLSSGNVVSNQLGAVPGMNFSNLDWFHLQVDDGTNVVTYTVTFENLSFFGFDPTITDYSFDPGTGQYDLTWDSRPDRIYGVAYVSDLSGSFSVLASNILSGGASTTNTVVVMPAGDAGFLQVFEECVWE